MNLDFLPFTLEKTKIEEINNLELLPLGKMNTYVGDNYGKLLILGRAPTDKPNHKRVWCICSCSSHTIKSIPIEVLKKGTSISCGCYRKEKMSKIMEDKRKVELSLEGEVFGDFTAIKKLNVKSISNYFIYECRCNYCGFKRMIPTNQLRQNANVCGCQISGGSLFERAVSNLLRENNVSFLREKTFEDFIYQDSGKKPRFDFFIEKDNLLIELNGRQHYDKDMFGSDVRLQRERDKIKANWALKNGFSLIVIPYYCQNSITIDDLKIGSKYQLF
jgi:orf114|nr:MAG TPA: restriction enzyme [Caudoviricetes sp.]